MESIEKEMHNSCTSPNEEANWKIDIFEYVSHLGTSMLNEISEMMSSAVTPSISFSGVKMIL